MTDVHDRFRSLDRVPVPELWGEATHRAVAEPAAAPQLRTNYMLPVSLATAAIVIALIVGLGVLWGPTVGTPDSTPAPEATPTHGRHAEFSAAILLGRALDSHRRHAAAPFEIIRRRSFPTARCSWRAPSLGTAVPPNCMTQAPGSWTVTGSMTAIRGRSTPRLCCPTVRCWWRAEGWRTLRLTRETCTTRPTGTWTRHRRHDRRAPWAHRDVAARWPRAGGRAASEVLRTRCSIRPSCLTRPPGHGPPPGR